MNYINNIGKWKSAPTLFIYKNFLIYHFYASYDVKVSVIKEKCYKQKKKKIKDENGFFY